MWALILIILVIIIGFILLILINILNKSKTPVITINDVPQNSNLVFTGNVVEVIENPEDVKTSYKKSPKKDKTPIAKELQYTFGSKILGNNIDESPDNKTEEMYINHHPSNYRTNKQPLGNVISAPNPLPQNNIEIPKYTNTPVMGYNSSIIPPNNDNINNKGKQKEIKSMGNYDPLDLGILL